MSTATLDRPRSAAAPVTLESGTRLSWWVSDTWELVKRNARHIIRTPELLLDVTIQPIIFVLLFRCIR